MFTRAYCLAFIAALVATLFAPTRAFADGPFDLRDERTGLVVAGYVGVGGFSNGAAFQQNGMRATGSTDASVGLQAEVGYRIVPAFTAGLHGTYQFLSVNRDRAMIPSGTSASAGAGAFGVYGRVHPLAFMRGGGDGISRVDLFAGIGIDFVASAFIGTHTEGVPIFGTVDTVAQTAGVAMPISIGVDFGLTRNIAIGALLQASYWTADSIALDTHSGIGSTHNVQYGREPEWYFFAGVGVRGTFNFLH
jgi:hypothetical protein